MVALVCLGNQFVDLSIGNLGKDAIAFADGQQNGVEHGVHATNDLRVRTLELFRFAAIGELALSGSFSEAGQFLLQTLQDACDVIDGLLHLLVIALVSLGDQFIDLAVGNLGQDAVAFADGQQNGVEHGVYAAHDLCIRALELLWLAAI